jgi:uncharacterized protein YgiM (DUF1202 family)
MKLRTVITNTIGGLIIVGLATGLSLVALAKPSLQWQKTEIPASAVSTPEPAPVVETPAPAIVTPAPVVETPAVKTATTVSFVRLRAGKSTTTDVLAELQANTKVTLLSDETSLWQQVQYGNIKGYIYKSYLKY